MIKSVVSDLIRHIESVFETDPRVESVDDKLEAIALLVEELEVYSNDLAEGL